MNIREALDPNGTWLLVEPFAGDQFEDNHKPVGRLYYAGSTFLCVPNALSQHGGYALGAQAGEAAIHQVTVDDGFTRFRRVKQTPFNLVFEVRPQLECPIAALQHGRHARPSARRSSTVRRRHLVRILLGSVVAQRLPHR